MTRQTRKQSAVPAAEGPWEAVLREPQQPRAPLDEGDQPEQVAGGGYQPHQGGIEVPHQRYERPAEVGAVHRLSPGAAANITTRGVPRGMRTVVSFGASAMRMSPSVRTAAPAPA